MIWAVALALALVFTAAAGGRALRPLTEREKIA